MPGPRELVLVGGGHAHVQVLRALAMAPWPDVRATVVLDRADAVYSGMVPGFVAGQYAAPELTIDVRPLARRAGVAVVVAPATRIDPAGRRIELEGRPPLAYDVASLDLGSTVAGLSLPGVTEHALATRPIGRFVGRVDALVARARPRGRCRLVVVGAGAGGVELAFAFRTRLAREGVPGVTVTLLESGPRVLPSSPDRVSRRVAAGLAARGIAIRTGVRVERIEAEEDARRVVLTAAGRETIACDEVVWVTGAAPTAPIAGSPLPRDDEGFVRVRATLQVDGHDDLFAAGDCAAFSPPLAKAGVFAVRQGPLLTRNLRARLAGRRLRRYRPQRDFLTLLNSGDGSAIGAKWGLALEGRAVFALKDRIDRRFVERFQVLAPDGAPRFAPMPAMRDAPCGGCAAKLGATPLARALARIGGPPDDAVVLGLAAADDAAAVSMWTGELLVTSLDAFRAFTDDPWLVGRVAAVHATSDLWAKGVAPRFALALVALPDGAPARGEELLYQVLAGARAALDAERVTLLGGHTIAGNADEARAPRASGAPGAPGVLAVGFAVWGAAKDRDALLRLAGLAPGERLVLTRPLGTGVLWRADMRGEARSEWIAAAIASMCRSNAAASAVAARTPASACTDVSGFGLAGHLAALLRASGVAARVELAALPLLPGVRECLARGLRSTAHAENARLAAALHVDPRAAADPALDALFDPQTGGGLLFGVAPERADAALAALREGGDREAAIIGTVTATEPGGPLVHVALDRRG